MRAFWRLHLIESPFAKELPSHAPPGRRQPAGVDIDPREYIAIATPLRLS